MHSISRKKGLMPFSEHTTRCVLCGETLTGRHVQEGLFLHCLRKNRNKDPSTREWVKCDVFIQWDTL